MTKTQTDQHRTLDYKLMQKANPLLFTPERYDQYPLNPTELIQYLTAAPMSSPTISIPRPVTEINEFDYLLYMGNNENTGGISTDSSGSNSGGNLYDNSSSLGQSVPSTASATRLRFNDIDIERKLACEFAIYLARMEAQRVEMEGHSVAARNNISFEDLDRVQRGSPEWYTMLLKLLESINTTNVNLKSIVGENGNGSSLGSGMMIDSSGSSANAGAGTPGGSVGNGSSLNSLGSTDGKKDQKRRGIQEQLQDVISYVLSNSIRYGVDVRPNVNDGPAKNDPIVFLKDIIDSILKQAVDRKSKTGNNGDQDRKGQQSSGTSNTGTTNTNTGSNTLAEESTRSSSVGDQEAGINDSETNEDEREKSKDKQIHELNIALTDLQLAHNFLTRQFENDRLEYSRDIEKLTRTNRELQEKLLNYHSDLAKAENKLQKAELKLDSLTSLSQSLRPETLSKHDTETPSSGLESPFRDVTFPELVSPLDVATSRGTFSADGSNSTPETPVGNTSFELGSSIPSNSLSIMQKEFKKLLTETQRRYETEINKERNLRLQLEKQLEERK